MQYNLILWGTGRVTRRYLDKGYFSKHNIVGIVDNNKKCDLYCNIPVLDARNIKDIMDNNDYLVITNVYYNEIMEQCLSAGVDFNKIVITANVGGIFFSKCFLKLRLISEELFECLQGGERRLIDINLFDHIDDNRLVGKGKYAADLKGTDYMCDYFRYRTFEFVAREIKEHNVLGELAEFGVFRGEFASLINETFPNRKLYLFDTFESFDRKEFESERDKGNCGSGDDFFDGHAKTSEEIAMGNVPYPESCIVCKGLFPSSVTDGAKKEKFAFVSLDVDFEESTYQGLKFFYPRLSENGYIFLHDYITHWLPGVKAAVLRFEKDVGITMKKVPIADRGGTLIITK